MIWGLGFNLNALIAVSFHRIGRDSDDGHAFVEPLPLPDLLRSLFFFHFRGKGEEKGENTAPEKDEPHSDFRRNFE